ncbi:MAG: Fur family transcriptional regulator [Spongiibacteraceae bacterium]
MVTSPKNLAFQHHDHTQCIDSALASAQLVCSERGVRLTPLRQEVLQLVWQSHKPLGAYTLLEQLANQSAIGEQRKLGPPTVYRALEFLREQGLVHRIDSLNAFIGCQHPQQPHQRFFLICRLCETAVELISDPLTAVIKTVADAAQFSNEGASVEITGLCPSCRSEASDHV